MWLLICLAVRAYFEISAFQGNNSQLLHRANFRYIFLDIPFCLQLLDLNGNGSELMTVYKCIMKYSGSHFQNIDLIFFVLCIH